MQGCPAFSHLCLTGGAIGCGPPLAVGAAVAVPEHQVINLQADGSAMYSLQVSQWTVSAPAHPTLTSCRIKHVWWLSSWLQVTEMLDGFAACEMLCSMHALASHRVSRAVITADGAVNVTAYWLLLLQALWTQAHEKLKVLTIICARDTYAILKVQCGSKTGTAYVICHSRCS